MADGCALQTIEDFTEAIYKPLVHILDRGPMIASLDSETTRIDAQRGFNPFYGPRVACGSLSFNLHGEPFDFAFSTRMKDGLLRRPIANPKTRKPEHIQLRKLLKEAHADWLHTGKLTLYEAVPEELMSLAEVGLHIERAVNMDMGLVIELLNDLTRRGLVWRMKNGKFDCLMYAADGFEIPPLAQFEDAEVQSHLTEDKPWEKGKRASHKLQDLAERHLMRDPNAADALVDWFKALRVPDQWKDYSAVPFLNVMAPYAWQDTRDTEDLGAFFDEKMRSMDEGGNRLRKLDPLYRSELEIILNLVRTTISNGMPVDQDAADALLVKYSAIRREKEAALDTLAGGHAVDWGSPKEVACYLFDPAPDGLGLPVPEFGRTKTNERSSSKKVLQDLSRSHPIAEAILEWRQANTFVTSFLEPIARFNIDGFVHPDFHLTSVRTGRMSCSHPNMQNRPKDEEIRGMFITRSALDEKYGRVPRAKYVMGARDYDQIEMRIGAHYAKIVADSFPTLRYTNNWRKRVFSRAAPVCYLNQGFNTDTDPKFDPHQRMVKISGLPRKKERSGQTTVKEWNFGRMYGCGLKGAQREYGWTKAFALKNMRYWDEAFPELDHLRHYINKVILDRGWIGNLFGRRYYIDKQMCYLGLNYLIQGCAGDLMKRGMNRLYTLADRLLEEYEGEPPMYINNTVHDEVVFEFREDILDDQILERVNRAMVFWETDWHSERWMDPDATLDDPMFNVPITAGMELGERDWGHLVDSAEFMEKRNG